ncbi:hypothetical protein TIFTF001_033897 [Ficus carica]|uniref:Uncharacterized protein n=1 Tax=Ficus carica TaxID=3494 RepID=A0AA88DZH7_FICCA|nr:hypothetical protein TIFTF001_033897 [Ficus carica]
MYEEDYPDEARRSSAVPSSAPTKAGPSDVEPPVQVNPSEDPEAQD